MLGKLFWSLAVTFTAMFAAFIDGQRDYYVLTDQALSLYFTGFGTIIVGLVISGPAEQKQPAAQAPAPLTQAPAKKARVIEVNPLHLLLTFFLVVFLFLAIIFLGQLRDPAEPSFMISALRTLMGAFALGVGLAIAERMIIRERAVDQAP